MRDNGLAPETDAKKVKKWSRKCEVEAEVGVAKARVSAPCVAILSTKAPTKTRNLGFVALRFSRNGGMLSSENLQEAKSWLW